MTHKLGIASDILMSITLLTVMFATITYNYHTVTTNMWNIETITATTIMTVVFTAAVTHAIQLYKNSTLVEIRQERNQKCYTTLTH